MISLISPNIVPRWDIRFISEAIKRVTVVHFGTFVRKGDFYPGPDDEIKRQSGIKKNLTSGNLIRFL